MAEGSDRPTTVSTEVVLRRFFRDVQQSELLPEIKRRRYFEKKPSRNFRRRTALGKAARRRTRQGF